MEYEVFERSSTRDEEPALAVVPDGRIALNAAASRLLERAGVRAVRILWDATRRGVALQGVKKGEKNSYSIVFSRGRSATISLKAFLRHIGWSSDRRQTIPVKWDPQQKMLEAEMPSRFIRTRGRKSTEQENTGS